MPRRPAPASEGGWEQPAMACRHAPPGLVSPPPPHPLFCKRQFPLPFHDMLLCLPYFSCFSFFSAHRGGADSMILCDAAVTCGVRSAAGRVWSEEDSILCVLGRGDRRGAVAWRP